MPWSAVPPDLNPNINPTAWKGTDWDQAILLRWLIPFKGMFAYGYRAREAWARWRKFPLTVLFLKGEGYTRFETEEGQHEILADTSTLWMFDAGPGWTSVIQYWCRWSLHIQWPFHLTFHCYFSDKDVPEIGTRYQGKRVWYFRFGARFDADHVYWFPSAAIGTKFN